MLLDEPVPTEREKLHTRGLLLMFQSTDRHTTPEENLIAAMLLKARDDGRPLYGQVSEDARRWVIHRNKDFVHYCEMIGLNPEQVRKMSMDDWREGDASVTP